MEGSVKVYSLKKEGKTYLTKHFQVQEFACTDGSDAVFIASELPLILEYIRARAGKSLRVNSGYRTAAHNKKVGGAEASQHLYGRAADIQCPAALTPEKLAAIAREVLPDRGGVGIYSWGIHVDVRAEKTDWRG